MNETVNECVSGPDELRTNAESAAIEVAVTASDEPFFELPQNDRASPPTVFRGAVWTVAGLGIMQVLRFASNLILTRLVSPYVFGVINLVNLFNQGLHMFSDLGVRQCVVNSNRGDEARFLNTAWTIQAIRGGALWLVTLAVCWPLSRIYETPQMLWLVPLVGLTGLFDGFTSTAVFTMSRRLERGKLVIRELLAYVISLSIVVLWLWMLKNHFDNHANLENHQMLAFAACNVLSGLLSLGLSYTLISGARNRIAWDPSAARELAHFGGWIFLSTACTFLAENFDRLYLGKLNIVVLASYNIAAQLARLPSLVIRDLGHQLVFPLYCRLIRQDVKLNESYETIHSSLTGFAGWLTAGAFAACPTLILMAYNQQYAAAADFVRWLSIAAWLTILQTSSETVLLALGQTRQIAASQVVKLFLLLPLVVGGYYLGGFLGLVAGFTLAEAGRYAVLSASVAKCGLPVFRLDLVLTLLVAATAGLTIMIGPYLEGSGGKLARLGPRFLGEGLLLTVLWIVIALVWWRKNGERLLQLVKAPR